MAEEEVSSPNAGEAGGEAVELDGGTPPVVVDGGSAAGRYGEVRGQGEVVHRDARLDLWCSPCRSPPSLTRLDSTRPVASRSPRTSRAGTTLMSPPTPFSIITVKWSIL
jgi:hypothetical protein